MTRTVALQDTTCGHSLAAPYLAAARFARRAAFSASVSSSRFPLFPFCLAGGAASSALPDLGRGSRFDSRLRLR